MRAKRSRRELEKYRKYVDGMLIQINIVKLHSLTNDVTDVLLECVTAMTNMSSHEERRNKAMEFQKQMESMKMSNELLGEFMNEDEENLEEEEIGKEERQIIEDALAGASFVILDKLPSVSISQPRNNNNNNNNNNNGNSIKASTNPHNILQEIDKYAKT